MNYLSMNQFIHRDLAARNCLLDQDFRVKVSDFGLTKHIMDKTYYKCRSLTKAIPIKWMAIESIEHNIFSTKTDVWSFGVLLWELFTRGETPYKSIRYYHLIHYLNSGHRLDKPIDCPQEFYDLCLKCWNKEPELRPEFSEILVILNGIEFEISIKTN